MTRIRALVLTALAAAAAALFLPHTAQGAGAATATGTASNHNISIVATGTSCSGGFCYLPAMLSIHQGDSVTWTNVTSTIHTVSSCTAANCSGVNGGTGSDPAFNSGIISSGGTFKLTFHGTGTYNYYCQIHGYTTMHGTITVLPFDVSTRSLPAGTVGTAYSKKLTTGGGTTPITWTLTAGKLPPGLKLGKGGLISGTPTATGTSTFTVKATDSSSPALTATKQLSIKVS